jgi:Flp pilus assembly protein TadG
VGVCGFVALAVDVGLLFDARTQCQNAADAAAMAGARSLTGAPNSNLSVATANALATAEANTVLSQPVQTADVTIQHGAYHYDAGTQTYSPQFPPVAPDTYNLTQVTVTHTVQYAFAKVFGLSSMKVSATAIAAHRPRDVGIVLDFSGSMNDQSDLWNSVYPDSLSPLNYTSNNTDSVFPKFGHYSSGTAALQCTSSDTRVGQCNITQTVQGEPALVNDFYSNSRGASSIAAFTAASSGNLSLPVSGDVPPHSSKDTSATWAQTVKDITGATTKDTLLFESAVYATSGYDAYRTLLNKFQGFTQGPGYWGKTFFIWPPDPRGPDSTGIPKDWRQRFFLKTGGSYPSFGGPVNSNTLLWDSSGNWLAPPGNYVINYAAILNWIKNTGPNPFPAQLRAGNILYYSAIPTDVPSSAYDHTQPNSAISNQDQRFWKEFIDYTLGVWRDPYGNIGTVGQYPIASFGPDYTWGTVQITAKPSGAGAAYMNYLDNPLRPRHRMWFGPMMLIQYLLDTGGMPGTAHELAMYSAKLGIQGAIQDIQNNHPNDMVSLLIFSRPTLSGDPAGIGCFSQAQFSLSRDYAGMTNALWFPPNSSSADVRPWDANGDQTPNAGYDYQYNTCTQYGLMLAYNQLSSSSSLRANSAGGLGRKGAQRLIVLETDGMANVAVQAGFTNSGAYNSYYNIGGGSTISEDTATDPGQAALSVAKRICALTTDSTNGPGFSTPNKPAIIHCLAFGSIFEPTATGTEASQAMSLLQQISAAGGTGFPSSVTATGDPNYYKLIVGTFSQRQAKMQQAFAKIMDDGISVMLIK